MNGVWIPSLRAAMLLAIVIIASLAFAVARISTSDGVASGESSDWTVAAKANADASGLVVPTPGQQAAEMRRDPAVDDREPGTWLLMIFGLGAVAFALRCRRFDRIRYQFA